MLFPLKYGKPSNSSGSSEPCAINVVTIGMALVNKKRRKQDITELQALLRWLHAGR